MTSLHRRMTGQYALAAMLAGGSIVASVLILPDTAEHAVMLLHDREYAQALILFEARLAENGPQAATLVPLARLYAQRGELDRAIGLLESLLARETLSPKDVVDARRLLGLYLRWDQRTDAQRANLAEIMRLAPTIAGLRELAAMASYAGDIDQQMAALVQITQATEATPDDFIDLAILSAARRNPGAASIVMARLGQRTPAAITPAVAGFWFDLLLDVPDVPQAVEVAQRLLASQRSPEMVLAIATSFLGRNKAAACLAALQPIAQQAGTNASVNLTLMRVASDAQDFVSLATLFDHQAARDQRDLSAAQMIDMMEFGFAAGRADAALAFAARIDVASLTKAQLLALASQALVHRQPTLLRSLLEKGGARRLADDQLLAAQIFLALDEPARAASAAKEAARLAVSPADSLMLAQIFATLGQPTDALRQLEKLAASASLTDDAIGDLAQLYLVVKRPGDGAATFERLRTLRPASAAVLAGWALMMAAAGRGDLVARQLEAGELPLSPVTLNDLFFVAGDKKTFQLQAAVARRLLTIEGATPRARLRLAQASLAAGRAGDALAQARTLRHEAPEDEVDALYRAALELLAPRDAAARVELRDFWRARLGDDAASGASRDEALYALMELRDWDSALPALDRRARQAPETWLGAYVSAARDAGRVASALPVLRALADDPARPVQTRTQAAYALIELAPSEALATLRRLAADLGGEWQDALDNARERAGLLTELRADLTQRARAPGATPDTRRAAAFRLLDLGDKAAALAIFQALAQGGDPTSNDAQQVRFLMGPRPLPEQLDWIEAQVITAQPAARLGWARVLAQSGAPLRTALRLEGDAAMPGRIGGSATLLAVESYIAAGDRGAAARLIAGRTPRETQPDNALRLGEFAQALTRADLARLAFERLFLLDPSNPSGQRQAGLAAFADGDAPRARDLLQRYLMGRPDDWEAHYTLGEALVRLRDRAGARRHHELAIASIDALASAPFAARVAKAYALYRLGRSDDSLSLFARLLREQPANRDLRADYAGVLIELGRAAQARLVLEGAS